MQATRRNVTLGLGAMALSACGGVPMVSARGGVRPPEPVMRAVPNAGYDAWVQGFRARASSRGISPATFDTAFRTAGFLPDAIERDRHQNVDDALGRSLRHGADLADSGRLRKGEESGDTVGGHG